MRFFYTLGIYAMTLGLALASPFNAKARKWVRGRRGIFRRMAAAMDKDTPVAWFHAASLGEFEQGRPVIEAFRVQCPGYQILVTFFSPSGYEVCRNYPGADHIFYLPADTPLNVRRFMRIVRPELAVFIKYEFWIHYLHELRRRRVQTILISALFRPEQLFFRPWGGMMHGALRAFSHLFVQDEPSRDLLAGIGIDRVSVTGDTRFDRVRAIAQAAKWLPNIARFAGEARTWVAGSTWPADEELIVRLIRNTTDEKFIVAPHEIDTVRIDRMIEAAGVPAIRYTDLNDESDVAHTRLLVIDTIGILSSVYRYGHRGYIGGGFGAGIHNTLEAAAFGLPLAFGPRYEKFREARDLIRIGAARCITDYEDLFAWSALLKSNPEQYEKSSAAALNYVQTHQGATDIIMKHIEKAL